VQFVTVKGERLAVVSASDWEALVEWLENLEDARLAKEALSALTDHGGDRGQAGWHRWEDVRDEAT